MPRHRSILRFAMLTIGLLSLATCTTESIPSTITPSEHATLVDYALTLINQSRTDAGLNDLVLDDNPAAQSHAENSAADCTRGHWDTDGLKPYMRYTLAGGEQYSAENVFAIDFCPEDLDNYQLETPREQIDFAMGRFLDSPGHRQTILDPHHRKVGIGLTYQAPTIWFVQLFVGDYIEYETKPTIDGGMLYLSGRVKNGADISNESAKLTIYYDPPPEPLTRGQLSRTYCYNNGTIVARVEPSRESVAPPPFVPVPESFLPPDAVVSEIRSKQCPDPYDLMLDVPAPMSNEEAQENWQQARDLSQATTWDLIGYSLFTAHEWTVQDDSFAVSADVPELLKRHGGGVYTVVLWGEINGEPAPISEYSIFVSSLPRSFQNPPP